VGRSTRRYIPAPAQWVRTESTQINNDSPSKRGESSSSSIKVTPNEESRRAPSLKRRVKNSSLPKIVQATVDASQEQNVPGYMALGLKYDPATLPLTEPLDPTRKEFTEEEYAATLIHGRSVHEPYFHPRTYDIPVANIHFRSHHIKLLNLFTHFAAHAASSLGIPTSKVVPLPTQRTLWTVLRSPFAHKKSQENFDRRVHKRAIKAWDADPEVVQRWVAYLRAHAMPGVGMRVTTWNRLPLGIGSSDALVGDDSAEHKSVSAPQKIRQFGKQIIEEEVSASPRE